MGVMAWWWWYRDRERAHSECDDVSIFHHSCLFLHIRHHLIAIATQDVPETYRGEGCGQQRGVVRGGYGQERGVVRGGVWSQRGPYEINHTLSPSSHKRLSCVINSYCNARKICKYFNSAKCGRSFPLILF